jgi:SAM-dependent methyltransferase
MDDLGDRWEAEAARWIEWARAPDHDSYWRFHRDQFLRLLPPPACQTVDIGCGEGRLTRHLKAMGHAIIGIDSSPSMVAAARAADPALDVRLADAAALPLGDGSADLAVAFMSLHDIDRMADAVREIGRVLAPGGRLCLAIVHPLNSAGRFQQPDAEAPFVIAGDYLSEFDYHDTVARDRLRMIFHSRHRPLQQYFIALEDAGFVVETLREPPLPEHAVTSESSRRWQRIPLFLHLRALRLSSSPRRAG